MAQRFREMPEEARQELDDAVVKAARPRLTKVQILAPLAIIVLFAALAITRGGQDTPAEEPASAESAQASQPAAVASKETPRQASEESRHRNSAEKTAFSVGPEVETDKPARGQGLDISKGQDLARPAGGPAVGAAQYDRLASNMSLGTVQGLLGAAGTEVTSESMRNEGTRAFTWDGPSSGSSITAVFSQDRLLSKSQFGLM